MGEVAMMMAAGPSHLNSGELFSRWPVGCSWRGRKWGSSIRFTFLPGEDGIYVTCETDGSVQDRWLRTSAENHLGATCAFTLREAPLSPVGGLILDRREEPL